MKVRKFLAGVLSLSLFATTTVAFAAAPSEYDGQAYSNLGCQSDDPDGEFNLAVIANGDVKIFGDAMYIKGSVYSNGTIYAGNGQGNKVDGLFISGTDNTTFGSDNNNDEWTQYRTAEGFVHVNDDGTTDGINYYSTQIEHKGAILDKDTSFECDYESFTAPDIANNLGDVLMTVYPNSTWLWNQERGSYNEVNAEEAPRTITEDTYIENLTMNGSWVDAYHQAMIIDTTAGDVNVVINNLVNPVNPSIKVVGEHEANIYINNINTLSDLRINHDYNSNWQLDVDGSTEHTHLYITGGNVVLDASKIAVADMNVTADSLEISGSTTFYGDISSNAEQFAIIGGQTEVTGTVCVPNADSQVVDSATLYGQLHTDTLTINGAGRIIWKADDAVAKTEVPEPTTEPTVEPTEAPVEPVPSGKPIDLNGVGYAYIFGYEPAIQRVDVTDDEGNVIGGKWVAEVQMAPNDAVTREQVAAMIMRLIDQKYDTKNDEYPVTDNIAKHAGTWYERGLAYLAGKGTFDGIDSVECGPVTRGEVAKLVAYGLNLSDTAETAFTDITDNQYKTYIEIMAAYGYMNGVSDDKFEPNRIMTRAEFCAMFNNIIGRTDMGLEGRDGTVVTPELYSIVDLNGHWAAETMLKATSAYDADGYVDIETRLGNIRNILDKYDSQTWF
ncbi:MAG: S-layer homology domain-containing protein [Clostridia bacterium]